MRNDKLFEIVTLQENNRLNDPVAIITGGAAVLSQIFPNIFGGSRKRLTDADWFQLIPGSGYWSTKFRNYLKGIIKYDTDFTSTIQHFTTVFVADNNAQVCPETYTFQNPPGTHPGGTGGSTGWEPCTAKFLQLLKLEQSTGGNLPIGQTPGGFGGTVDWSAILPLAIGGIILVAAMKSKRKTRRK